MANLVEGLSLLETEKIQKAMMTILKNQFHRSPPTVTPKTKLNLFPFPGHNLLLEDPETETSISPEATVVIGNMTSLDQKEETTKTGAIEEVHRK